MFDSTLRVLVSSPLSGLLMAVKAHVTHIHSPHCLTSFIITDIGFLLSPQLSSRPFPLHNSYLRNMWRNLVWKRALESKRIHRFWKVSLSPKGFPRNRWRQCRLFYKAFICVRNSFFWAVKWLHWEETIKNEGQKRAFCGFRRSQILRFGSTGKANNVDVCICVKDCRCLHLNMQNLPFAHCSPVHVSVPEAGRFIYITTLEEITVCLGN